jgi:Ca2+-binding EF-hand superfamily protein
MRVKFIAGAAALILVSATVAFAQTAAQVRQEEMRFRGMDANNDGQIQRTEWRGSAQSFRVHDWNNDGILSGAEIRTAARREAAEAPDYQPNDYGYNDWSARGFTALDDNRDGRISRQEWHYDNETFYRVDRDRNNFISRAEFLNNAATQGFDDDRGDRFDDLDVNGNNRVERGEWHGSVSAFEWLDRNNDGVLARAEMVGNAPVSDDQFTSKDINRDRFISRSEWHYSPGSFSRLDTNRDGRLSRVEFDAAGPLGATGTAAKVNVNGYDRWTDTGIFVRTGDEITFDATGRIQFSQSAESAVEWRGAPDGRKSNVAPMPDVAIGHLIARIGIGGAPMSAGGTIRAPRDGRLYLGVNDDVMTDNSGSFQVTVTLRRP